MNVSVVVPIYYCDPVLYLPIQRCFTSLEGRECELLAIDDASPISLPPNWPIEARNYQNLGFTATVNKGLAAATGNIMVVMNDDIVMTDTCWDRITLLDPTQVIIASPADTASSNDDRFGSCWAITRYAYQVLGPLNEEYRNFWSDYDYYLRAQEKGVAITKWKDIVLEHPESSTFKLLDKEALLAADLERYTKRTGGPEPDHS